MPNYFAITEGLASWLLGKPGILAEIASCIQSGEFSSLRAGIIYGNGPIRFGTDESRSLLAAWHADYLSGTGVEDWAFVSLQNQHGLLGYPEIIRETFERASYVASQRLRGLVLDGGVMHKALHNGVHTCLSGRGVTARQLSLGYYQQDFTVGQSSGHGIVISGPFDSFPNAASITRKDSDRMDVMAAAVTATLNNPRLQRSPLPQTMAALRARLESHSAPVDQAPRMTLSTRTETPTRAVPGAIFSYTYFDWLATSSSLTDVQRRLIDRFPLDQHPLRILGPAGSGKTLLMQLLAIRAVERPNKFGRDARVLYVTHNSSMTDAVRQRFDILTAFDGGGRFRSAISVKTLSEFGREFLELKDGQLLDRDAHEAKLFQLEILAEAFEARVLSDSSAGGPFCGLYREEAPLRSLILALVAAEISAALKGNGIDADRKRYVESERSLSRLHGVLKAADRELLFDIYRHYQSEIREHYRVLDADDLALTLLSSLKAPLWALQRDQRGFDYIFVDETQLFNENERRIFPLLSTRADKHVPLALALDDAQDIYGYTFAGVASLGLGDILTESLPSVQRSTPEIVRLAMFIISQSSDLFGVDFPEFEASSASTFSGTHTAASVPRLSFDNRGSLSAHLLASIDELRQSQLRSIGVVVHAERYFDTALNSIVGANLPLHVLQSRGEKIGRDRPLVVLSRPENVGGQEFDAVIVVGLEEGVSPPNVATNEPLAVAVEQQAVREMYLSISRARSQVVVVVSKGHEPNRIIRAAREAGLLQVR